MMTIRNRAAFEERLLRAAHRLDGLRQIDPGYLSEIRLLTIEGGLAMMKIPAAGHLREQVFRLWLEKDLAPILRRAFEHCGEELAGVRFLVSL